MNTRLRGAPRGRQRFDEERLSFLNEGAPGDVASERGQALERASRVASAESITRLAHTGALLREATRRERGHHERRRARGQKRGGGRRRGDLRRRPGGRRWRRLDVGGRWPFDRFLLVDGRSFGPITSSPGGPGGARRRPRVGDWNARPIGIFLLRLRRGHACPIAGFASRDRRRARRRGDHRGHLVRHGARRGRGARRDTEHHRRPAGGEPKREQPRARFSREQHLRDTRSRCRRRCGRSRREASRGRCRRRGRGW